jgi:hypothetical protein
MTRIPLTTRLIWLWDYGTMGLRRQLRYWRIYGMTWFLPYGFQLPLGYGFRRKDHEREGWLVSPIPLNVLLRLWDSIRFAFVRGLIPSAIEEHDERVRAAILKRLPGEKRRDTRQG